MTDKIFNIRKERTAQLYNELQLYQEIFWPFLSHNLCNILCSLLYVHLYYFYTPGRLLDIKTNLIGLEEQLVGNCSCRLH